MKNNATAPGHQYTDVSGAAAYVEIGYFLFTGIHIAL